MGRERRACAERLCVRGGGGRRLWPDRLEPVRTGLARPRLCASQREAAAHALRIPPRRGASFASLPQPLSLWRRQVPSPPPPSVRDGGRSTELWRRLLQNPVQAKPKNPGEARIEKQNKTKRLCAWSETQSSNCVPEALMAPSAGCLAPTPQAPAPAWPQSAPSAWLMLKKDLKPKMADGCQHQSAP